MTARQAKSDIASAVALRPNISKDLDVALETNQYAQLVFIDISSADCNTRAETEIQ